MFFIFKNFLGEAIAFFVFKKIFGGGAIVFLFLKKFLEGELWWESRYYFSKKELSQNIPPFMVKITKKIF